MKGDQNPTGDWIEWAGEGVAPPPFMVSAVRHRDGTEKPNAALGWWSRFYYDRPDDIIAYRVVQS